MVGIGGIGMSAIADLLLARGYNVSGSDIVVSPVVTRLLASGVRVFKGHAASHIGETDLVVVSSAIPDNNQELLEAKKRKIPIIGRGALLAELARGKRTVAVAGSHGKTTTTAMITFVLEAAGLDPTAVIGGVVSAFGSNTKQGQGEFMVVESDESDRSFLCLTPEVAILTNVDDEHLDAYGGIEELEQAFETFVMRVPATGWIVACVDDPRLINIVARCPRRAVTYGIDADEASVRADDVELGPTGSTCRVTVATDTVAGEIILSLAVPGRHNLRNALAAVAAAACLGIEPRVAGEALGCFTGVERRFQCYRAPCGIDVIDDYGHHPTEIAAVFETVRLSQPRRLIVLFQPHRFTRISRLIDRFGEVLAQSDLLVLTDVYAASEEAIDGADSPSLAEAVRKHRAITVELADDLDDAVARVARAANPGDVVVVLGAGSVGKLAPRVVEALTREGV